MNSEIQLIHFAGASLFPLSALFSNPELERHQPPIRRFPIRFLRTMTGLAATR